jgi:ABC-type transporter Mla subunit MlaD
MSSRRDDLMAVQANYFKLGLFIIIGTLLLAGGVIVLGVGALFGSTMHMETYVDESVQGLEVGAPIKHRGVKIGSVTDIGFVSQRYRAGRLKNGVDTSRYVLVEGELDKGSFGAANKSVARSQIANLVEDGLRVRMALSGITGVAYLEVDFLDTQEFPPPSITWQPKSIYIPAARSTFGRLINATEAILTEIKNANIGGIAKNLDKLLTTAERSINEANVGDVSAEAKALLAELRSTNDRLQTMLNSPEVTEAIADASSSLATVRRLVEGSEEDVTQFLADLPKVTNRLQKVADELSTLLDSEEVEVALDGISASAEGLPDTVAQLRRTLARIDNLVAQQQAGIQEIVENLRVISSNVVELSNSAKEYPSQVLFGDPPPRDTKGTPE